MKRYTYIFIALILLCQLSFSSDVTNGFRSAMVASMAPSWNFFVQTKDVFLKLTTVWPSGGYYTSPEVKKELEMLKLENHNFRYQIELLKAQIDLEKLIGDQAEKLRFSRNERRKAEIVRQIDLYTQSMIGKVVFRETASWSSSLWINVGEKTNRSLGKTIIAKNSPVVVGTNVVGIVEYVGDSRSRVRLITDGSVVPSVRVLRGGEQKQIIAAQIKKLSEMVARCDALTQAERIQSELVLLAQNVSSGEENIYLAKGELQGVRQPIWRSRHTLLQGVGFNYDFEDEEGPSRDLRRDKMALVKVGDVLITTGMDGIFPAGLMVGQVSKVYPLQEGATAYELDAEPLVEEFENLTFVTVLPPIEQNI